MGGSVAVGYHDNILGSSTAEEAAFGTDDPDYLFVVEHLEDARAEAEIWGQWEIASFYKKLRFELGYRRSEWMRTAILGQDRFEIRMRQKLPDEWQIDLRARYSPQIYLRHRRDKDAPPGAPAFRPESFEEQDYRAAIGRTIGQIRGSVAYLHAREDRNRWFNERDETIDGTELSILFPLGERIEVEPEYLFASGRSRNEPDLGSDRSYRDHGAALAVSFDLGGTRPWEIAGSGRLKWREYTTGDPLDESRYHRNDRIYGFGLRASIDMGVIRPFAAAEWGGRIVRLPAGASAADEEGEYESSWIRSGVEWEIR